MLQKWVDYFEREAVQQTIRTRLVDPILSYVLRQIFPYIMLICIMFSILLLSSLLTLGILIMQFRKPAAPASAYAAA